MKYNYLIVLVSALALGLFGCDDDETTSTETEAGAETQQMVDEAVEDEDIYSKLAKSLAPEIYGHVDVKKVRWQQIEAARVVRFI